MAETMTADFDDLDYDEDSDIDEDYQDCEDLPPVSEMDLLSSLADARTVMLLYINDEPVKAAEKMEHTWKRNLYHAHGHAAMAGANAILTFQQTDFENAIETMKECATVINHRRNRGSLTNNMVTKLMIRPNYDNYTDEQCHAELCYAESLIFRAFLAFLQDGNVLGYIKGGLKIRKAHQVYKECNEILEHRTKWDNEALRLEFESGVDIGLGIFNLVVSSLPPRVAKFLQFIGFSGEKEVAFQRLNSGHSKHETVRGFLCTITLLVHNCISRFLLGYPQASENLFKHCDQLLKPLMKECSNSALIQLFDGRLAHIRGNLPEAIEKYERVVTENYVIGNTPHVPSFELAWIHMATGDFRKSVFYADKLCNECRWARTMFYYMKAIALLMCDDLSDKDNQEVIFCMKEVPKHVQRFLGRSSPVDKYCFRKSERFFAQNKWLPIPAYEMMYVANYFYLLKGKNNILEGIMARIDRAIIDIQDGEHKESPWQQDNYSLAVFLKGLCLSYMGYPLSAEEYFLEVVENQNNMKKDMHYVSFALLELGYIAKDTGNYAQALKYLTASRFASIFVTEFRIHQGILELKRLGFTENNNADERDELYH